MTTGRARVYRWRLLKAVDSLRWCASLGLSLLACGQSVSPTVDAGGLVDAPTGDTAVDVRPLADQPEVGRDVPMLGNLPQHVGSASDRFLTADECAVCHSGRSLAAMRDRAGNDVSPVRLWDRSMMAFSARDPYWLAAFSHERQSNPRAVAAVEQLCTRCHAPAGAVERALVGERMRLDDITRGNDDAAVLGREGVGCTLCHSITAARLGTAESFNAQFEINTRRELYGPHADPLAAPMIGWTGFAPVYREHLSESGLCASCHTVLTRSLNEAGEVDGPLFPEQVPYLEWRNSVFNQEGTPGPRAQSCQGCHMPSTDDEGNPIETRIASVGGSPLRTRYGRHGFLGGNAYMLSLLAANTRWAGTWVTPAELNQSAAQTARFASTAARVELVQLTREGATLRATVRVLNRSGHRFPTGYPTRRAWLHFRVEDERGAVRFESGAQNAEGAIVGATGQRLDGAEVALVHRDRITSGDEVQVYEGVPVDHQGRPTHALLRAVRWVKDNRLLPEGWSPTHPDAAMTTPVGVTGDNNFVPGEDAVTYEVSVPAEGALRVTVNLRFQTVTPAAVDIEAGANTLEGARFVSMARARPPVAITLSTASQTLPQ